jgi:hypothetical protein
MHLYSIILFIHVLAAMGVAAAISLLIYGEVMAQKAQSPAELRSVAEKEARTAIALKALVPVLALTGLYMAWAAWSLIAAWVILALVTLAYLAISGPLLFGRRMQRAVDAAAAAGSITPEVRDILDNPMFTVMKDTRIALLVMLIYLMTVKPGLVGTLAALVAALVLGVASARMRSGVRIDASSVAAPES